MEQESENQVVHALIENIFNVTKTTQSYMHLRNNLKDINKTILIPQIINQIEQLLNQNIKWEKDIFTLIKYCIRYKQQIQILTNILPHLYYEGQLLQYYLLDKLRFKLLCISEPIKQSILNIIQILRIEQIDKQLENIFLFLQFTNLYDDQFQNQYIQQSIEFFTSLDTIELISDQYERECKLFQLIDDEDVSKQLKLKYHSIIQKQLYELSSMQLDNIGYMQKLYKVNEIIKSNLFRKNIYELINEKVTQIISTNIDVIQKLIDLKYYFDDLLELIAPKDDKVKASMNDAFESAILIKVNTLSEQFSFHIDQLLTKQEQLRDENKILKLLERSLTLFRYFSARDIFEHFYTQRLTKRLILEVSVSTDIETQCLSVLKQQCGEQYVRKAEEIIKDVYKSVKFNYQNIQANVILISQNSWTLNQTYLPKSFLEEIQNQYYRINSQELKQKAVKWPSECSNCQVQAFSQYILTVSAIQAYILMLFNEKQHYHIQQIITTSGLSKGEIIKNILPLAQNILIRKGDYFLLNKDFNSKKKNITINQMQKKEIQQEVDDSTSMILNERKYMIDACIVKIMKRDRRHTVTEIISLVQSELRLPLKNPDIKRQIEVLTEKEYLRRDPEAMNIFDYIA